MCAVGAWRSGRGRADASSMGTWEEELKALWQIIAIVLSWSLRAGQARRPSQTQDLK